MYQIHGSKGYLCANSFREFLALLARDVDWEVLASLVRNLPALCPWHLLLHLLWDLLAVLLGHLGTQDHTNIECGDEDYLLALLMVAVAMAFFFVAGRALLFIFPVDDSLVHLLETHTLSVFRGNQESLTISHFFL